jgi:hypothetical protein
MPTGCRMRAFDFLALVCLGLSVVVVGWVVGVTVNPRGWYNPFPPVEANSVQAVPVAGASATITSTLDSSPEPAMPTEVSQATPTLASSPAPTETPFVMDTPTLEASPTPLPTVTLAPTPTPSPTRSVFTFTAMITLQVHPVQVCDWMGVAGTVVDLQGKPALGEFVRVWGLGDVDQVVAVGANPVYGSSGWEVRLARSQIVGNWNVQLVASLDAKIPLSDIYTISMPGDCKRNLALVRFQQNH